MTEYPIGAIGRYESTYNDATEMVTIWDVAKGGIKVLSADTDSTLTEAIELLENEQGEIGPISAEEIRFLLETVDGIEQTIEHAAYDLERYGAVGVSC